MEHFKGINPQERYDNELLSELKKVNANLEQIAQLLQGPKEITQFKRGRKPNGSNHIK